MKHNCSFQAESGKCVIYDLVHAVHAVNDVLNPSKRLKNNEILPEILL